MKKFIVMALLFSNVSQANIVDVLDIAEKADLTQEQLHDCVLLQRKLNRQAKIIEQANSKLELLKTEIDKRSEQIDNTQVTNNEEIKNLNKIIIKQKNSIVKYNSKVDHYKEKFTDYQIDRELFNTNCADKSYEADDMEFVIEELGNESDKYSLIINLTPADAQIKIMNIAPKYEYGILLEPGKYDIYITHPDYLEYRKWIEIKDSNVDIDVILKKK